jgi:hypothetical protein
VTLLLFATAGVMALVARRQVAKVGSPVPRQALEGIQADVHTVTSAVKER